VSYIISHLPSVKVIPIPGPSALIAALSVSAFKVSQFTFLGYAPHKKGRRKFFTEIKSINTRPIVLYESTHRLEKTLLNLQEVFGGDYGILVCRELTKIYEERFEGSLKNALVYFRGERKKGEFVLIIP